MIEIFTFQEYKKWFLFSNPTVKAESLHCQHLNYGIFYDVNSWIANQIGLKQCDCNKCINCCTQNAVKEIALWGYFMSLEEGSFTMEIKNRLMNALVEFIDYTIYSPSKFPKKKNQCF